MFRGVSVLCLCGLLAFSELRQFGSSIERSLAGFSKMTTTDTAFDAMVHEADGLANDNLPRRTERPQFDVKTWAYKSSGGLTDENRVKIAKIYRKAESVFEYGLGESTMIADHVGVPRYSGIDSDPVWIGNTRQNVSQHFRFYLADIGETGMWGRPKENLRKSPHNYMLAPLMAESRPFDVYMIDGRWRFGCLLASFLHASSRGLSPGSPTVMVHDCDQRERYHRADHLLKLKVNGNDPGQKLCIYKRKPETTDEQLLELWMETYTDPQ